MWNFSRQDIRKANSIQIAKTILSSRHRPSLDQFPSLNVEKLHQDEFRKIILNSLSKKAPGGDKINIQFIIDSIEVILDPVTDIIIDDVNKYFNGQ